jgi:hypothetical protein
MGKKVDEYKDFEIWYFEEGEVGPQAVYQVKGGDDLPFVPGYRKSEKAAKKLIDKTIMGGPVQIDTFMDVPIFYNYKSKRFRASMEYVGSTIEKKSRNKEKIKEWISENTG